MHYIHSSTCAWSNGVPKCEPLIKAKKIKCITFIPLANVLNLSQKIPIIVAREWRLMTHDRRKVRQLCDGGNNIVFYKDQCIMYLKIGTKTFASNRQGNIYKIDMDELSDQKIS